MKFFDSHAHYNDSAFGSSDERKALIAHLLANDVGCILNAGTNPTTSRECLALAEQFEHLYAAVGIHPSDLYELTDPEAALNKIRALASHPKAVAIGEIGLDYHWHEDGHDFQKEYFHRQLALAEELDLPVIVHDREAHGDCLAVVAEHPKARGVFHSYSGSAESAKELLKRGWYISFSGVITFKNATRLAEIVPTIPDDRLLLETDCPYLTPHPHRGKRNDSGYLVYTAEKLAELRHTTSDRIIALTHQNAATLFSKTGLLNL